MFCGVHFMAESADVLTGDDQTVILPDLNAGCSMADMADIDQVEEAWDELAGVIDVERLVPITYMNSSAALKAFVGRHGGAVCTSSNARAVLEWALGGKESVGAAGGGDKVLFFPDQHLGRNTGVAMGYDLDQMRLWNPRSTSAAHRGRLQGGRPSCSGGATARSTNASSPSTSRPSGPSTPTASSSCTPSAPTRPCCSPTRSAPPTTSSRPSSRRRRGAHWPSAPRCTSSTGSPRSTPTGPVLSLDPLICPCSTMNRIDLPHLAWVLEELVAGRVVNRIEVDADTTEWSKVALQRMLEIV